MRILVWNINMAAHKKLSLLRHLDPDLAIVPECAAPDVIVSKCPSFTFTDAQWLERSRHKGLGVFSFGGLRLTRSGAFDRRFEVFLPLVHVSDLSDSWQMFQKPFQSISIVDLTKDLRLYREHFL